MVIESNNRYVQIFPAAAATLSFYVWFFVLFCLFVLFFLLGFQFLSWLQSVGLFVIVAVDGFSSS